MSGKYPIFERGVIQEYIRDIDPMEIESLRRTVVRNREKIVGSAKIKWI